MLIKAEHISQPYSGEYEEKIYDIKSNWNSSDWTWVRFEEDDASLWCGEFRGKYIGVVFSDIKEIAVVVTSDYIYIIDKYTKDIIDSDKNDKYSDITCTPISSCRCCNTTLNT